MKWAKLTVNSSNQEEVLQSGLINIVPEIKIEDPDDQILEHLLAVAVSGQSLKTLKVSGLIVQCEDLRKGRLRMFDNGLSSVPPSVLAAISRLEKLSLYYCDLTAAQRSL